MAEAKTPPDSHKWRGAHRFALGRSLRPQWRVFSFYPTMKVDQRSTYIQRQPFSSLEDNTVGTWAGEFRQVEGPTDTMWVLRWQQPPMGGRKPLELSCSQDFCFHWLPSPCLMLWSVSNSLRSCRQEQHPTRQLMAGAGLWFPEWSSGYLNTHFPPFNTYYFLTRVYLALSSL